MQDVKVDVIIPVYKPGVKFKDTIEALMRQSYPVSKIIIMNTEKALYDGAEYGSKVTDRYSNIEVHHVTKAEFDHGKTRNMGVSFSDAEIFVMLTDDATPYDEKMIANMVKALEPENVASCYGHQLPGDESGAVEGFTRQFNYPDKSFVKTMEDLPTLGIKTFFCSNACAAYKRVIFDKLGGFTNHTIFNEDMIYASGVIRAGYAIAYAADAKVIHAHKYTCREQFGRNFDNGVSQADHPEVFEGIPSEKEGKRLVADTLRHFISKGKIFTALYVIVQSGYKFLGYKFGRNYKKLSAKRIMKWTMNKNYWKTLNK